MNIIVITHIKRGVAVAFCEVPDDVSPSTVVEHWVAMQGLSPAAKDQFSTNWGSVKPWAELKDVFTPYSELTPSR